MKYIETHKHAFIFAFFVSHAVYIYRCLLQLNIAGVFTCFYFNLIFIIFINACCYHTVDDLIFIFLRRYFYRFSKLLRDKEIQLN